MRNEKLGRIFTANQYKPTRTFTLLSNGKFVKKPKVLFMWLVIILFISCNNPFVSQDIPQGYGSYSLHLAGNAGRAVLPGTPLLADFAVFELDFAPTSGGLAHNVRFLQSEAAGGALPVVILVAGTYNLTVNVYLGCDKTTPVQLAAVGTASVIIAPGADLQQNIQLKALLDGTVTGNFNWSASVTATDITSAVMTVTGITPNASTVAPVTLTSGANSGNPALNPGMYNVNFKFEKETGTPVQKYEAEWNELLYIYSSLVSNFTMTFDDNFFYRTQYNVTFHFNDTVHFYDPNALSGLHSGLQSILHADVIGVMGSLDTITSRGYRFDGWFRNADFSGTAWNLASNPVLEDMTLHAKWTPNQITITLIDIDNMPAVLGVTFTPAVTPNITLSRSGAGGNPVTQNITVNGLEAGDSFGWAIKGKGINAAQSVTGTTSPITLDAANLIYNSLGWHTVELNIIKGGLQYRTSFVFQIIL